MWSIAEDVLWMCHLFMYYRGKPVDFFCSYASSEMPSFIYFIALNMWSLLLLLLLFCIQLFIMYFCVLKCCIRIKFSVSIHKGCCFRSALPPRFQFGDNIWYRKIRLCFSIKRFLGMSLWLMSKVKLEAKQHFKPAKYQIFRFRKSFRKDFCGIIFSCTG